MHNSHQNDFTFYDLFIPLTSKKIVIFIIIIGFVVYFNALFNTFVWDDLTYVVFNPDIHSIHLISSFKENSFNKIGQYRPITAIYFSLLYFLFTITPFFYHIAQVSMHIINALVIFFIFNKFFGRNLAFFLSLIFLVHPIQVESVSFIGASDNTLFFFFGALALLLANKKITNFKNYFIISLLLLLSLLSKETGFGFLCLTLLWVLLYNTKKIIPFITLGLITVITYCTIRFLVGGVYFDNSALKWIVPIANLSLSVRVINIPQIILHYLVTFIFPLKLAIDQQWVITTPGGTLFICL